MTLQSLAAEMCGLHLMQCIFDTVSPFSNLGPILILDDALQIDLWQLSHYWDRERDRETELLSKTICFRYFELLSTLPEI